MLNSSPQRRKPRPPKGSPLSPPRRSGANDNFRIHAVPPSQRRLARHGASLLKLNPYLRVAGEAWNILENLSALQEEGYVAGGGWSRVAKCSTPDPRYYLGYGRLAQSSVVNSPSAINLVNNCLIEQAVNNIGNPFAALPSSARTVVIGRVRPVATTYRAQAQEAWSRPDNANGVAPPYRQAKPAIALPPRQPHHWTVSYDPAVAPPMAAPAFAPPVPRPQYKGWTAPNRSAVYAPVGTPPMRGIHGDVVPNDWSVSITTPSVPVGAQAAPRTHELSPPRVSGPKGRKVKESKQKMSRVQVLILKGISMGTEGIDLLDVLYNSVPSEFRPRWKKTQYEKHDVTLQEKMRTVYDHVDKIDLVDLFHNYSQEQLEDFVYGKIGQIGGDISKRLNIPYAMGPNSIASRGRRLSYDVEREQDDRVDGEN